MDAGWHLNIYIVASLSAVVSGYAIAALVGIRARHLPASRPFAFMSLCGSTWCLYPTVTSLSLPNSTLFTLARLIYMVSGFTIAGFLHLSFAITEDERRVWRRRWLRGSYAVAAVLAILVWTPWFITGLIRYAPYFAPVPGPLYHLLVLFYFVAAGYGVLVTIRGVRRTTGAKKNQLRYFLLASGILSLSPLLHFGASYLRWEPVPHDFLIPIFAAIVAVAIMRHQLLDIRIVVNKALVYSALIASMTACYLVMVLMMERWFQGFFGYRSALASLTAAFFIAIFFDPLRNRIQALVDRAVFAATPAELAAQREQLLVEVRKNDQMKAVGTLAAGLAHEIKNPLASIKTFAEYLPQKYDDPQFREKFAKIVPNEIDKMNTLVYRLLEFARPNAPTMKLMSVSAMIQETLDLLQGTLLKEQIQIETLFDPMDRIQADEGQLKQALLNVLLNSIEAMGGQPGRITVSTVRQNGSLAITVADTGPGIPKKDLQRVFNPFYTTKQGGTGLGLAVVDGIVRQHGGRIFIESQETAGTTCRMILPLQYENESAA